MIFEFSGVLQIALLISMALIGIGLLKAGLWPRRWGKERRCGCCEYVVERISGERCPECGSLLAGRGTVRGQRRRLAALWGSGAFLLLVAMLWGGTRIFRNVYGDVKLDQFKPTAWIFNDLESKDWRAQDRAWAELMHRLEAGALSSHWEEKMIDAALSKHLAAPSTLQGNRSFDFVWREYKSDRLNAQQVERFFGQLVKSQWKIRPVVLVGQDLPFHVEAERYLRDGWMRFGISGNFRAIFEGGFGIQFIHDSVLTGSARQMPGEQEVEIHYFAEYFAGEHAWDKEEQGKPVWRRDFVHREKIRVLAKSSDEFLKPVDAPELAEQIRNSIQVEKFGHHSSRFSFDMDVSCKLPPMNVAFDVLARIDGKEYPTMQLVCAKGMEGRFPQYFNENLKELIPLKPKKVDLIFRTNEELAGRTVEFFDVWKGEVILKDVQVATPKQ